MLTAGCSTLERVVYRPDINQGNYLTANDVSKIRVGMTQQQVAYALGNSSGVLTNIDNKPALSGN
ncbi:outer membrane protein assembly factor BamE [Escherichia coli]|nr:outer membrane protein assembly factor BamE [Escherichia coli]